MDRHSYSTVRDATTIVPTPCGDRSHTAQMNNSKGEQTTAAQSGKTNKRSFSAEKNYRTRCVLKQLDQTPPHLRAARNRRRVDCMKRSSQTEHPSQLEANIGPPSAWVLGASRVPSYRCASLLPPPAPLNKTTQKTHNKPPSTPSPPPVCSRQNTTRRRPTLMHATPTATCPCPILL